MSLVLWGLPLLAGAEAPSPSNLFDLPIHFQDETGHDVLLNRWRGEKIVIAPAYTTCRITCPMVITEQLQSIEKAMDQHNIKGEILFITIDPETDTTARLASFRQSHDLRSQRWHFLRTTPAESNKMMSFLYFKYALEDGHINHDRKIFAFDNEGTLLQILNGFNAPLGNLFNH